MHKYSNNGLINNIKAVVEEVFGCEGLLSSSVRTYPVPDARKAHSKLCVKYTRRVSYAKIGASINRDHSTVVAHLKKHEDLFTTKNAEYIEKYNACEAIVKGLSDEKPVDFKEILQEKIEVISQSKCEEILTVIESYI